MWHFTAMIDESEKTMIEQSIPFSLTERQKRICCFLDALSAKNQFWKVPPSILFKGALYVSYPSHRGGNPDWMAQAAHSLRDITYGVPKTPKRVVVIKNIISRYQEEIDVAERASLLLSEIYEVLTDIAHHFNEKGSLDDSRKHLERVGVIFSSSGLVVDETCFEEILKKLEEAWEMSLPSQLRVFTLIDNFLVKNNSDSKKEDLESFFRFGHHVRQYFYTQADEHWLSWLWENNFLDAIRQKSEDQTRNANRLPELYYLVRMADKEPKVVTDIMLAVPISPEIFNLEIINQFLWICGELSARELVRMLPKIRRERWILLMKDSRLSGFRFEKMLSALIGAKDWASVLLLSSILLSVREKEEGSKEGDFWADNPFYFSNLEDSDVFGALEKIDDEYLENALKVVSETMKAVVFFNEGRREPRESFKIGDGFAFYDIDFFTLETEQKKHISYRDDVRELAAILKFLIVKIFRKYDGNTEKIRELYEKYIDIPALPDSQAMWRFRLFVFSLSRDIFAREINQSLSRISEVDRPSDLTSGAEYEHLLKENLDLFSEEEKPLYKEKLFNLMEDEDEIKQLPPGDIFGICSIILEWLTDEERKRVEEFVGKEQPLNAEYVPEPAISYSKGGWVQSRSPISPEELNRPIVEIAKKLRTEWDPKNLHRREEYTETSLLEYSTEGLSNMIKEDVSSRLRDYIDNAELFFEPGVLDECYTHAFLQGILDSVRKNGLSPDIEWSGLFKLFEEISSYFGKSPVKNGRLRSERSVSISMLAGWDAVHSALADLVGELCKSEKNGKSIVDFRKYREQFLKLIRYLLSYSDPNTKDEICNPRPSTRGEEVEYDCSDPFTHAINSVRGKAFEALVNFTYRDGERFPKDALVKIDSDVKDIYETALDRENTRALFFLFGHYFPSFYFRDREWARNFFGKLFDFSPVRRDLSLAAWEGYLANNLYKELFQDLEVYYLQAIELDKNDPTPRKYFKDIDEALATHIALAFVHFSDFTLESRLFQRFWKTEHFKRHAEFVSFIGRYAISCDQAKNWIEQNKIDSKKLENFWDWILEEPIDIKVFESFGFWMDAEWGVFDPIWQAEHVLETLKKTNGATKWDHNLQKSLPIYAKASPEKTLEILRIYMLEYLARRAENQGWIHMTDEITDVFRVLYENSGTREKTYDLINDLLPYGNGLFWKLKDVIM